MKEIENSEDKLVFSDGDKTIVFNRLEHDVAMEVRNCTPADVVLTVHNFVTYITWQAGVDINNVEHGEGRLPKLQNDNRSGWDRLKNM